MSERRCDHPAGGQASRAGDLAVVGIEAGEVGEIVRPALHPGRFTFQVADGHPHRCFACFDHGALHSRVVGHGVQHAGRLGGFEGEVEARYSTRVRPQRVTVWRQPASAGAEPGEHGAQIVRVDLTVEVETGGAAADPLAVRFSGAGVVVAERLGDAGQVVGLLADAELGD